MEEFLKVKCKGLLLQTKYRSFHHIFPAKPLEKYNKAHKKSNTVPALVVIALFLSSINVESPKSITLMGLSSALVKNIKFSGFKSL